MTPKDYFCVFSAERMVREALDKMHRAMNEGRTKGECIEILKGAYEEAMTFLRRSDDDW